MDFFTRDWINDCSIYAKEWECGTTGLRWSDTAQGGDDM